MFNNLIEYVESNHKVFSLFVACEFISFIMSGYVFNYSHIGGIFLSIVGLFFALITGEALVLRGKRS